MQLPPHPPLLAITFALGACTASTSSTSSSRLERQCYGSSSASASAIGTPTNSAALPPLSGVSPCAANCVGLAAAAAYCSSEGAVNCLGVAPLCVSFPLSI
ncbi:hypothetical protein FB451DRAFT_1311505 [Mycena latifolia]|nr:hypothetical protein FB451DRAFT_1311505 [Mycena latifolia]